MGYERDCMYVLSFMQTKKGKSIRTILINSLANTHQASLALQSDINAIRSRLSLNNYKLILSRKASWRHLVLFVRYHTGEFLSIRRWKIATDWLEFCQNSQWWTNWAAHGGEGSSVNFFPLETSSSVQRWPWIPTGRIFVNIVSPTDGFANTYYWHANER